MTKLAYIRATQQHQQRSIGSSPTKILQPPIIGSAMTRPTMAPGFKNINNHQTPKPMIMTPTTRFNTNPTVLITLDQQQQENGGRISKPLMEKRRRARINQCLSQLKTIVVDGAGQCTQNNKCKLEKADILELTVNYVKHLHRQQQQQSMAATNGDQGDPFLAGYAACIRQLSDHIGTLIPDLDSGHRKSIQDHLDQCLSQHQHQRQVSFTPPSPAPSSEFSSSSSSAGSSNGTPPSVASGTKRNFSQFVARSDDEEEEEEEEDEMDHSDMDDENDGGCTMIPYDLATNPLNLKIRRPSSLEVDGLDDDVWRPW